MKPNKTYAIKDVTIDLENPTKVCIYYTGTDGYVHDDVHYVDGYKRLGMAQTKILKEVNDLFCGRNQKVNDNCYIESKKWFHYLSIVEIEENSDD